jgi:HD superfamily phosphohydrolase
MQMFHNEVHSNEVNMPNQKYIRDLIYGYISFDTFFKNVIDTEEFQRLRYIKQLSFTYLIFPSACHSRFEHCLGTYHMAGVILETLLKNSDSKELAHYTPRHGRLIKLGALLHDIGHTAFSHIFDEIKDKNGLLLKINSHEERSMLLVKSMNEKYEWGLSDKEVLLVQHIISGIPLLQYPRWYFQIVSNHDFEIDCDKLDYIRRDSFYCGVNVGFQPEYMINNSKIIDGNWCFHSKTHFNIYQLFIARAKLHKEVYKHHTNIRITQGINHFMKNYFTIFPEHSESIVEAYKTDVWLRWTDENFNILLTDYIRNRKFPKIVRINSSENEISDDEYSVPVHIGFVSGSKNINPVDNVKFYDKSKVIESRILPNVFKETLYYIFKKE